MGQRAGKAKIDERAQVCLKKGCLAFLYFGKSKGFCGKSDLDFPGRFLLIKNLKGGDPPSGGNGMEMHDGFILFLDKSGNKKVLLASEDTFSVVEEVSH